jgi:large subunit ribosomal protein L24
LEKCNLKFKHLKPINQDNQGQRKQIEAPIDISNVMLCDSDTIASRFRTAYSDDNGKKVRISKKTNQLIL